MKKIIIAFIFLVLLSPIKANSAILGLARVVDGDTIIIRGKHIRLLGIDAPEKGQICTLPNMQNYRCGEQSKYELQNLINGRIVRCNSRSKDQYNRALGECYVNNINVNSYMVSSGWAFASRNSSRYVMDEQHAKMNRLGVWQGGFMKPSNWKKRNKLNRHRNNNGSLNFENYSGQDTLNQNYYEQNIQNQGGYNQGSYNQGYQNQNEINANAIGQILQLLLK
jgi:endonuclease YncB( thermonuclease family)